LRQEDQGLKGDGASAVEAVKPDGALNIPKNHAFGKKKKFDRQPVNTSEEEESNAPGEEKHRCIDRESPQE
jgi:hypothetical protein